LPAARHLVAITRCNSNIFETCTKRVARQSAFWLMARRPIPMHTLQIHRRVIFVSMPSCLSIAEACSATKREVS
jgi:hypothetical protein